MRTLLRSLLALCALVTAGQTAAAQIPYDDCGQLVQGVTCPILFFDSQGRHWLLSNTGGNPVGSTVRVQGLADPNCITICQQGGCIAVTQIGPCGGGTPPGTPYCFGDGSGTPCPCGNNSPAGQGRGCLHSLGNGALLGATGTASVSADTVVLMGSDMPNASALYFQGTAQINGGLGAVFGDGLRCAGGTVIRLATKTNVGGQSQFPAAGDPAVSVQGACVAGDVRHYQIWYRNAADFCTPSTFNLSNGLSITWGT
jgi:hypothetical protein